METGKIVNHKEKTWTWTGVFTLPPLIASYIYESLHFLKTYVMTMDPRSIRHLRGRSCASVLKSEYESESRYFVQEIIERKLNSLIIMKYRIYLAGYKTSAINDGGISRLGSEACRTGMKKNEDQSVEAHVWYLYLSCFTLNKYTSLK